MLQASGWTSSWETYFTNMYCEVFKWEKEMHGEDEEMQVLFEKIVEKVIPRLLRPLETGDNTIQPRFVHGDLWDGNASTDAITKTPVIFDGTSFYGHSECTLNEYNLTNLHADIMQSTLVLGTTHVAEFIGRTSENISGILSAQNQRKTSKIVSSCIVSTLSGKSVRLNVDLTYPKAALI